MEIRTIRSRPREVPPWLHVYWGDERSERSHRFLRKDMEGAAPPVAMASMGTETTGPSHAVTMGVGTCCRQKICIKRINMLHIAQSAFVRRWFHLPVGRCEIGRVASNSHLRRLPPTTHFVYRHSGQPHRTKRSGFSGSLAARLPKPSRMARLSSKFSCNTPQKMELIRALGAKEIKSFAFPAESILSCMRMIWLQPNLR